MPKQQRQRLFLPANENISNMFNAEVYTINGVKVRNAGQGLNGLKKGVYLINGKKAVVK